MLKFDHVEVCKDFSKAEILEKLQNIQKTTSEEESTFEGLEVNAIAFVYIGFNLDSDH